MKGELLNLIRIAAGRGASDSEIARVLGYSAHYIGWLRRANDIPSGVPVGGRPRVTPEKIKKIVDRLMEGATLQEIGDALGITRERARQLANRGGANGGTGIRRRRENRSEKLNRLRDERYQRTYGCSFQDVISRNDGMPLSHPDSKTTAYRTWVRNVLTKMGGVGTLTFAQWCDAWKDHWDERGRGRNYRLSRIDRMRGFTPENLVCERGDDAMSRHIRTNPWDRCKRPIASV